MNLTNLFPSIEQLSQTQRQAVDQLQGHFAWIGPIGSGKTSASYYRILKYLREGIPSNSILILTPQRSLAEPYQYIFRQREIPLTADLDILTLNGLAQRMLTLFWAVIAQRSGFEKPQSIPTFLTIETAQYAMLKIVSEKMDHLGYFAQIRIDRNRLCSQLLDNLNKSAVVGFDHHEISTRLKSAWNGASSHLRMYDQAQECIDLFREFCLQQQCLDYSLQMKLFVEQVWTEPLCRDYLVRRYRHLIVDNLEEDTPCTHQILSEWIPSTDSSLLISDEHGGYRRFLGADPISARALQESTSRIIRFDDSWIAPEPLQKFSKLIGKVLKQIETVSNDLNSQELGSVITFQSQRFYPQMLDWCTDLLDKLIHQDQVSPDEIVVVAPFLPDTLRFALQHRLQGLNIHIRTMRPSRSLREEPLVACLLTLARLAHPAWRKFPSKQEIIFMFLYALADIDLVRAKILADQVYREGKPDESFPRFAQINSQEQKRITYLVGEHYDRLINWIEEYRKEPLKELDIFFRHIFGMILSTRGFGFFGSHTAGETTAKLVESARKFRINLSDLVSSQDQVGAEFVQAVENGLIAALYQSSYRKKDPDAVLIAPAHTYLMQNQSTRFQIWLDVGSNGWWSRLEQPLTHPYVLSQEWEQGRIWTDADEFNANQAAMFRMVHGLLSRCKDRVYLAHIELNEQGTEQRGELLKTLQTAILRVNRSELEREQHDS